MRLFEICTPQQQLALLQRIVTNTWRELEQQASTQPPTVPPPKPPPKPRTKPRKSKPLRRIALPPRTPPKPKAQAKASVDSAASNNTLAASNPQPIVKPIPPTPTKKPIKRVI